MGVVRRDDRRELGPAGRHPQRRRHARACRRRRPTSARTCGARSRPSGSGSSARRSSSPGSSKTLTTLEHMERYGNTGQYYNWYDHRTGAKLWTFPDNPNFHPMLSSVDNGWLAVGLKIVENSVPQLHKRAGALYDAMDFGFYYGRTQPGALPLPARAARRAVLLRHRGQRVADRRLHRHRRAGSCRRRRTTAATARSRTPATGLDGDQAGRGVPQLLRRRVFEARLPYAGMRVVPSWGGSMFEALMPDLFVPEENWAPKAGGQPPADRPGADLPRPAGGRLRLLGLLALEQAGGRVRRLRRRRHRHDATASRPTRTNAIDHGFAGCPGRDAEARPAAVGVHQRRRHAARRVPRPALRPARDARQPAQAPRDFPGLYTKWGFRDSVNVDTGRSPTPTCRSTRG